MQIQTLLILAITALTVTATPMEKFKEQKARMDHQAQKAVDSANRHASSSSSHHSGGSSQMSHGDRMKATAGIHGRLAASSEIQKKNTGSAGYVKGPASIKGAFNAVKAVGKFASAGQERRDREGRK